MAAISSPSLSIPRPITIQELLKHTYKELRRDRLGILVGLQKLIERQSGVKRLYNTKDLEIESAKQFTLKNLLTTLTRKQAHHQYIQRLKEDKWTLLCTYQHLEYEIFELSEKVLNREYWLNTITAVQGSTKQDAMWNVLNELTQDLEIEEQNDKQRKLQ